MTEMKLSNRNQISQHGFTLIEVLVASFILFLVISSITLIYRNAILSSSKAESAIELTAYTQFVIEQVRIDISQADDIEQMSGSGSISNEIAYQWEATVLSQSRSPSEYMASTGQVEQGKHLLKYWRINLQVNMDGRQKNYVFNEVSW